MADTISIFTGSADEAREIVAEYEPDYIVVCFAKGDIALYRTADEDNFSNRISGAGVLPGWVAPVSGYYEGPLRVYLVSR